MARFGNPPIRPAWQDECNTATPVWLQHWRLLYEAFSYYFLRPFRYREETLWKYGQALWVTGVYVCKYAYNYSVVF